MQIENLWDSLLREYPVGSFLLSKTNSGKYHLMDGQQRATSIFLGFYNPFTETASKAWSIQDQLPVLWIDIDHKIDLDTRKYLLRLVTRSHPWGYQAKDQGLRMSVSDRYKALELFQKDPKNTSKKYTSFANTSVYPYDANCPLPLCFFIEAETTEEVIDMVKRYLPDTISTKLGNFEDKSAYLKILENSKSKIEELLVVVKRAIRRKISCDIISDSVLNEEQTTDNPTLFVRINSAGTSLSGDDLIYSIYKATFPDTKQLVEKIGLNFVKPTRVISLVSRMVWSEIDGNNYPVKMNVRQFQQRLKNEQFKQGLMCLVNEGENTNASNLFTQAINILQCKESLEGRMPPVIVKQLINKSPDLFLFLLCWLRKHTSIKITTDISLKITAKLLIFHWFGIANISIMWREVETDSYWELPIDQQIELNSNRCGVNALLPPQLLRDYYTQEGVEQLFVCDNPSKWEILAEGVGTKIIDYYRRIDSSISDQSVFNTCFSKFLNVIRFCRSLVLFAQRTYINEVFGDYNQMDSIEDTNTPWDWDHIYPSEWVYRKMYCNKAIKDWNYTIGNLRAISLEQNRREGHRLSPGERLSEKDMREISFIGCDWKFWEQIDKRIYDDKVQNHFRAITQRMIAIYEKFWNDMKVQDLISGKQIV